MSKTQLSLWKLIFAGIKFQEFREFFLNSRKLLPVAIIGELKTKNKILLWRPILSKLKSFNHMLLKRKFNINIFLQIFRHNDFFNIEAVVRRCFVKTALCLKRPPPQVCCCEFSKHFQNNFSTEHHQTAASVYHLNK